MYVRPMAHTCTRVLTQYAATLPSSFQSLQKQCINDWRDSFDAFAHGEQVVFLRTGFARAQGRHNVLDPLFPNCYMNEVAVYVVVGILGPQRQWLHLSDLAVTSVRKEQHRACMLAWIVRDLHNCPNVEAMTLLNLNHRRGLKLPKFPFSCLLRRCCCRDRRNHACRSDWGVIVAPVFA